MRPIFTRADYVFLAAILAGLPGFVTRDELVETFADALVSTSPYFDRQRFIEAANGR